MLKYMPNFEKIKIYNYPLPEPIKEITYLYICICNKLPASLIQALIDQGWEVEQISETTGCSQNCGSCKQELEDLVNNKSKKIDIDII